MLRTIDTMGYSRQPDGTWLYRGKSMLRIDNAPITPPVVPANEIPPGVWAHEIPQHKCKGAWVWFNGEMTKWAQCSTCGKVYAPQPMTKDKSQ